MSDLAAKIESALGEHTLRGGPRDWCCTGCTWSASTRFSGFATNDHRAHLARDVIAPLVEVHGREAAAAALEAASMSDEQIIDEVSQRMADRANARLAGRYPPQHIIKQELRDDIAYALKPHLDRAAQHRSKP